MKNLFALFTAALVFGVGIPAGSQKLAAELFSFTNLNLSIPDGAATGAVDTRSVNSSVSVLTSVKVRLKIAGEFNGDLYCYLRQSNTSGTNLCVLLNRPGRAASAPLGYADSGMDVTFDDAAPAVDIHRYRDTKPLAASEVLSGTWQPDGRKVDPLLVSDTSARTTTLAGFLKGGGSGQWTLFVADVDTGATNMLLGWELELQGRQNPLVTWNVPADFVYGSALSATQLNASATVPGAFSYSPPLGTVLPAGTSQKLSAVFTPTDTVNLLPVTNTVLVTVLKKPLTLTADSLSKVYGQTSVLTVSGYRAVGLIGTDSVTGVSLTCSGLGASAAVSGSPYPIVPSAALGNGLSNYAIDYVSGALTVASAATTATLRSSVNPVLPGSAVTFTCDLAQPPSCVGAWDGLVQFAVNGVDVRSPVPLTGSSAAYTAVMTAGSYAVSARYLGSGNLKASASALANRQLVNTPPVAGNDQVERWSASGTKVSLASVLANDTDADGEAVTLVSVAGTSALGGTVRLDGSWIVYLPASGSTAADRFTYIVSDGRGATVTGTVVVAVKSEPPYSLTLTVSDVPGGQHRIHVDGIPDHPYRIQFTADLQNPLWTDLSAGFTDTQGVLETIDPFAGRARFYRSVYP